MIAARALALATALALAAPASAGAQAFFASRPHPEFAVGPLSVRARISPELGPATVEIGFSIALAPTVIPTAIEQDLFMLWPGSVGAGTPGAPRDASLAAFVEARGYTATGAGALALVARDIYRGRDSETVVAAAPFVTFVRERGANGITPAATWIRIPWRPELVNRTKMMRLRFASTELARWRPGTWFEETFRGRRQIATIGFHDVRSRGMFPLYLEHRDRVLRLTEDPSQIVLSFPRADRLQIESVAPPTASRRMSETRESTQLVSMFIERTSGVVPQTLTVEYGYFSGVQSWMPIAIPIAFFLLGNLAAVAVRLVADRLSKRFSGRVQFGHDHEHRRRETGVIVSRDLLARIAPGETTYEQVVAALGPTDEEYERLDGSMRRTLVYRGRRLVPRRRRTFGWLATVDHWDAEDHETEIQVERDRVVDVQARVRRSR
ncbi:MAG: hypothetical protein HYR51_09515, partial [Candidatus Rokubacteria bacterium]|nr:hypothetical protein [Candidatus Rokubacteria bacterium]